MKKVVALALALWFAGILCSARWLADASLTTRYVPGMYDTTTTTTTTTTATTTTDPFAAIREQYSVPFVANPRFCIMQPGEGNNCEITPSPA